MIDHPRNLHADDAERILIGQLLLEPNYYLQIYEQITADDFARQKHKVAWEAYRKLWAVSGKVEPLELAEETKGSAGAGELLQAMEDAMVYRSTAWALRKVKAAAGKRRLYEGVLKVLGRIDAVEDPSSLYDELSSLVIAGRHQPGQVYAGREIGERMLVRQDQRRERGDTMDGYRTRFPSLDAHMGGLAPKRLTILSGPSGHGKTALCLQWLANMAIDDCVPSLFASLEMDTGDIQDRLGASLSDMAIRTIRSGAKPTTYVEAVCRIERSTLLVSDNEPRDIYAVCAMIEKHALVDGIKVWMLDYIGELVRDSPGFREERDERFSRWVKMLRDLNKRLGLHGVVVSQVNSERQLAESKKMAHVADAHLHFYRDRGKHYIDCRKNRFGPTGYVYEIAYDRTRQKMEETGICRKETDENGEPREE